MMSDEFRSSFIDHHSSFNHPSAMFFLLRFVRLLFILGFLLRLFLAFARCVKKNEEASSAGRLQGRSILRLGLFTQASAPSAIGRPSDRITAPGDRTALPRIAVGYYRPTIPRRALTCSPRFAARPAVHWQPRPNDDGTGQPRG